MLRAYAALLACLLSGAPAFAQTATTNNSAAGRFGAPPSAIAVNNNANTPAGNNNNAPTNGQDKTNSSGCSRSNWLAGKCTAYPGQYPGTSRYRRPIVVVPASAPAPVDDTPLASDWEGCRKTKLNQLNLTESGNLERAKQLDEWLWKNCRSYSEDLRQLEQDQM
ncbi:MAG TPA: hypothetical protein VLC91_16875 [Spongiibacteraceae bacterium]|nr:hypothetical protein [Spongiibacteraceae bacterium]